GAAAAAVPGAGRARAARALGRTGGPGDARSRRCRGLRLMAGFIVHVQWFFLAYFIALQLGYLVLNLLSLGVLRDYMENTSVDRLKQVFSGLEPPITIVVAAYNEAANIVGSLRSLLQLNYPEFEIVVINDGSTDD